MRSSVLSGRHSIAPLTWLLRQDLLCEFSSHLNQWLDSLGAAHEFDVSGYLDEVEPGFDWIVINDRDVDVERLSSYVTTLHASLLSIERDVGILEPLWIAESLGSWSDKTQAVLTTDLGEIFASNWKFDHAMRVDMAPILALIAHIREPQISPDSLTYAQLIHAIDKAIVGTTPLDLVRRRLLREGIKISGALLSSVMRNESRYLLLYSGSLVCVDRAEHALSAWRLAAELLDPSEYLKSSGLGFDGKVYWRATHRAESYRVKKFFDFHQDGIAWNEFDWLEICLKLSYCHSNDSCLTQGIPSAVHRFIVEWIVANGKVWRMDEAERTLGHAFEFDAEDISPGRLLVYGSPVAGRMGSGTLVVREMVSRGKQLPGLIHSSRIVTPFDDLTITVNSGEVESLLWAHTSFPALGMSHVDDVAEQLLRRRGHPPLPYVMKLARLACIPFLPQSVFQVGRGLLVNKDLNELLMAQSTAEQRRRCIIEHFASLGVGRQQLRDRLSSRTANAVFGN